MGSLVLTCGHQDHHHPDGWPYHMQDVTREGIPCTSHGSWCSDCYANALMNFPDLLFSSWEESREWLTDISKIYYKKDDE